MGDRHFRECLWLGVLQCISSVFAIENETLMRRDRVSSFSKSFWRRRMLPRYEGEAAVRAKSSTYEISKPLGVLK